MQQSQYSDNVNAAVEISTEETLEARSQELALEESYLEGEAFVMAGEIAPEEPEISSQQPFSFETHFRGLMGMAADLPTVADYLDAHEGWFCRCAQPMTAEPFGENGYILTVGKFKSFGYEVEPKMAVVLLPPKDGLYVMHSLEVPDYTPLGYELNYTSSLTLEEVSGQEVNWNTSGIDRVTKVEWQLHLFVKIQFPPFIYKLPRNLLQTTGDRLLSQIVRQISPRLTYKVQKDFHDRLNLSLPPKSSRQLLRL
ncbi:DUF1997 domain-containing protein [Spirulina sp. 06S082]|uniref:DUF1997 domain-containing protein n=1 Tax=Spirulina sp. 06S082 TaxID=3110248 RepID=UPI002B216F0D|nr:DUF1997 domain-containing protein [Spirulina sp. 06S082]MEA5467765.1 DUF1997 domain-containing protein [Spirulina sp. 06S082]